MAFQYGDDIRFPGRYVQWQEVTHRWLPDAVKRYIDVRVEKVAEKIFYDKVKVEMKKLQAIAKKIIYLEKVVKYLGTVLQQWGNQASPQLWTSWWQNSQKLKNLWSEFSAQKIKLYNPYSFMVKVESADGKTDYEVQIDIGFRGSCQDAIKWGI